MVGEPIISIVFFSGMPSDAAGPVAESVTPMLMSAMAMPAAQQRQPEASADFSVLIVSSVRRSVCGQRNQRLISAVTDFSQRARSAPEAEAVAAGSCASGR